MAAQDNKLRRRLSPAAFTLLELLIVIAIVALVLGILLPITGRARLQAKIVTVEAELRGIGIALEAYAMDNQGRYPPTRVDCMLGGHFYQLPCELVESRYLPAPDEKTFMAAGVEDRFNPGYTYKYRSVGTLIYNRTYTVQNGARLWVPDGFPFSEQSTGCYYDDLRDSPVSWVLYSVGPRFDLNWMKRHKYPVPRQTWYNPERRTGIIVRLRLKDGNQIGSFER